MTTKQSLTPAAQRDLAKLLAGEPVSLRYGPFKQLLEAGYIDGTQDDYALTSYALAPPCDHAGLHRIGRDETGRKVGESCHACGEELPCD